MIRLLICIVIKNLCNKKLFMIQSYYVITQYFKVPKEVRLKTTHFFIVKIPNKRELQQVVFNHSSDIYFQDFL